MASSLNDAIARAVARAAARDENVRTIGTPGEAPDPYTQPAEWVTMLIEDAIAAAVASFAPDVQIFEANAAAQQWVKPAGASAVRILVVGAGGGGGSGRRGAPGTVRTGGGGGHGGGFTDMLIPAASLPATVEVWVPFGALGGAAVTVNDTNGNPSAATAQAGFGAIVAGTSSLVRVAGSNPPAAGGSALAAAGGAGGTSQHGGGVGGTSPTGGTTGTGTGTGVGSGGPGGGGGGISTANVAANGGPGQFNWASRGGSAPGGVVGGALPATSVDQLAGSVIPAGGGGGGASSVTAAAQDGANGATPGGGGGGGGASTNGFASGKGGNGGNARIVVVTW